MPMVLNRVTAFTIEPPAAWKQKLGIKGNQGLKNPSSFSAMGDAELSPGMRCMDFAAVLLLV